LSKNMFFSIMTYQNRGIFAPLHSFFLDGKEQRFRRPGCFDLIKCLTEVII
jgi:hypothetical protein